MKLKVTLNEVNALIDFYKDLANKLGNSSPEINHIKMRLGYWNKVKTELEKEDEETPCLPEHNLRRFV